MSEAPAKSLTPKGALRLEGFIIGLGILALLLIFQPFSLTLFAIGSGLVVLAGLVNNLLPLAKPGVKVRSIVTVALVVALIFCCVLLISIAAAHLSSDPQVTRIVSPNRLARAMAIVPMPLVPPWSRTVSPSRAYARSNRLLHTVNSVSGIAAASTSDNAPGTARHWRQGATA